MTTDQQKQVIAALQTALNLTYEEAHTVMLAMAARPSPAMVRATAAILCWHP